VVNGSFKDRFVEGIYLHADHATPMVRMYDSQAFVQGDLLPGDGYNGKVYISPPPGFTEDEGYVYQPVVLSMACPALLALGMLP
jgi:hypothetical protein